MMGLSSMMELPLTRLDMVKIYASSAIVLIHANRCKIFALYKNGSANSGPNYDSPSQVEKMRYIQIINTVISKVLFNILLQLGCKS